MATAVTNIVLLTLIATVVAFAYPASAIAGTATFYTNYVPSTCYGPQDQGVMIVAVSDALWRNGAACGKRYNVRCTGPRGCKAGSVTVKVVDRCPSNCQATLDLSREAFSRIADPAAVGRINIEYNPA